MSIKTKHMSTEEFAQLNFVKAASIRSRFSLTGSYFGVVPKKLSNGKLAWPVKINTDSI